MIKGIFIINNHGKPRVLKIYDRKDVSAAATFPGNSAR